MKNTMTKKKTILIDGDEEQTHREDKKIGELKREVGFPEEDVVKYKDGPGESTVLEDDDTVADIPEGASVSSQPVKGKAFG